MPRKTEEVRQGDEGFLKERGAAAEQEAYMLAAEHDIAKKIKP